MEGKQRTAEQMHLGEILTIVAQGKPGDADSGGIIDDGDGRDGGGTVGTWRSLGARSCQFLARTTAPDCSS